MQNEEVIEVRIAGLEKRMDLIEQQPCKMEYIAEEFTEFKSSVESIFRSVIFWLVGMILTSLVCGLSLQYRSFQEVNQSIFNLEKQIILLHGSKSVHNNN